MENTQRKLNALQILASCYQAEISELQFRAYIEVLAEFTPAESEAACREAMCSDSAWMPRPGQLHAIAKRRRADLAVAKGRIERLEETLALANRSGNQTWVDRCTAAIDRAQADVAALEGTKPPPIIPPKMLEQNPTTDRRKEVRVMMDNISQAKRLR